MRIPPLSCGSESWACTRGLIKALAVFPAQAKPVDGLALSDSVANEEVLGSSLIGGILAREALLGVLLSVEVMTGAQLLPTVVHLLMVLNSNVGSNSLAVHSLVVEYSSI
jgi:hypothetical protein